jgi:hypothetical protein
MGFPEPRSFDMRVLPVYNVLPLLLRWFYEKKNPGAEEVKK